MTPKTILEIFIQSGKSIFHTKCYIIFSDNTRAVGCFDPCEVVSKKDNLWTVFLKNNPINDLNYPSQKSIAVDLSLISKVILL